MSDLYPTLKPNSTIGILGGGQLGRMICFAAHKLGYKTLIFSDTKNSPASFVCNQTIVADYLDKNALMEFANKVDIVTFEFENIPTQTVEFIASEAQFNKPVFPNANVLKITQNRLCEKDFINQIGIKTTEYKAVDSLAGLRLAVKELTSTNQNLYQKPTQCLNSSVLKTTTMGYDGKGQIVINQESNLEEIWQSFSNKETSSNLQNPKLILEKFTEFKQEISVIVARSANGEIACYQPLTNIHKNGILHQSIYPANISQETRQNAIEIATKIVTKLSLVGVLAVEFFVLKNDELLVNELAPRPHNSGHFSMDACYTSQFEQLVRAISGLPLGDTDFYLKGYMKNLIGEDVLEIEKYLDNKKAKLHLYGKDKIATGRKMGHINFLEGNQ